ncbi:hypothetical protein C0J52_25584 [Blattella germanica]|nr:hypothetical protein C0J52_25584 [Blattella germanica]
MFQHTVLYILYLLISCQYVCITHSENIEGELSEMDPPIQSKPTIFLLRKYPDLYMLYQLTTRDITNSLYDRSYYGRSARDVQSSTREGRVLFKFAAKQLKNLFLWGGALNSGSTGSLSASNSFNLFGKTINSALSLSYGDRFLYPPIVPPVAPIFPPVVPPVLPPAPFPVAIKSAVEADPGRITNINGLQTSVPNTGNNAFQTSLATNSAFLTSGQNNEENAQRVNDQYIELEKMRQKIMSEPVRNSPVRPEQTFRYVYAPDVNEQWKQFLKQHNVMVDGLNSRLYMPLPRVNII